MKFLRTISSNYMNNINIKVLNNNTIEWLYQEKIINEKPNKEFTLRFGSTIQNIVIVIIFD
ncbi:hypothetical protein I4U23_017171 [Adineta vaga]|nr:hypothetical protein I4U23_017171 [Adineta vaga]